MLTIESRGPFMHTDRKGALLMLAVMLLVALMPASACLLAVQPAGHPSCCHQMAQECGPHGISANSSCCQAPRQNAAVAPASPYSPERVQQLALAANQASVPSVIAATTESRHALEAPPPKSSSGHSSILRT